jgi:hypothetical protein
MYQPVLSISLIFCDILMKLRRKKKEKKKKGEVWAQK